MPRILKRRNRSSLARMRFIYYINIQSCQHIFHHSVFLVISSTLAHVTKPIKLETELAFINHSFMDVWSPLIYAILKQHYLIFLMGRYNLRQVYFILIYANTEGISFPSSVDIKH